MQTNGIGAAIPRPTAARAAYGLETGAVGGAASRSTFPVRQQPSAIPSAEPTPVESATLDAAALKPPKGTDPELWKVLTADERAFFAREGAMGPLSYGLRIANTPSLPARGGRLNLRG